MLTVGKLRSMLEEIDDDDLEVRVQIIHNDGDDVLTGGLKTVEVESDEEGDELTHYVMLGADEEEIVETDVPDLDFDDEEEDDEDEDPDSSPPSRSN